MGIHLHRVDRDCIPIRTQATHVEGQRVDIRKEDSMSERKCIWTSVPCTELVESIMAAEPGMKDDVALFEAYDTLEEDRRMIAEEFKDIRGHFVLYGSAGLWDGRHGGFTPLFDTTLKEAFERLSECLPNCDSHVSVYIDGDGELYATKAHHDGVNSYTLRQLDREYDEDELEEIAATEGGSAEWFGKNARPCGHYIAQRWGLEVKDEGNG